MRPPINRARGLITSLAALCILFLLPARGAAQIVNVQPKLGLEPREGISGDVEQSLSWKTGNTEKLAVGGALAVRARKGRHTLLVVGAGRYESTGGDAFDSQLMEHLRYRVDLAEWFGLEAFAQHEFNEFRRLRLRALGGLGPRFAVRPSTRFETALGTAYMTEYERLDWVADGEGGFLGDSGERTVSHRWSSYLSFNLILDGLQLAQTTYVQPRFDAMEDLRMLAELAVVVQLWEMLSLKVAGAISYDTRPPLRVDNLDTSLETSFAMVF